LRNQKGCLCFEVKKSYLLQVLGVVFSCKGIKGQGGGVKGLVLGVSTFYLFVFCWASERVKKRKEGKLFLKFQYGG